MVSPLRRPPTTEDELVALFEEAERRGVNIGPSLALSATPQEAVVNIKARLGAEARPGVQQVRQNVRAPGGLSGFLKELQGPFVRPEPPPDAGLLDRLLPGFRSLAIPQIPESWIEPVPERLKPAARAVRELTSPLSLATLPIGGVKGGLLGAGGFVGGSQVGSEIGGPKGELIGGIAGGIAAPLAPVAGRAVVRGGQRLAEEAGRTNVGNVLLPRAPKTVARPLIYENLTPAERKLYGIESKGRLTPDEIGGARDYLYGPADPDTGRRPGGLVSPEDTARIQGFEERYRGTHQLAERRRKVERVVAKYIPPEEATGPIAQAGFGGEMGPGQVARGAAEQARMTQAPLSEIAASEADRIAKGRQIAPASAGDSFLDEIARLAQEESPSGDWVRAKDLYSRYRASGGTLSTGDFTRRIRQTAGPDAPIETMSVSRPGQEKGWLSYPRPNGYSDYLGGVRVRQTGTPPRAPISQEPAAGPRPPAAPPFAPTGAVSQAAVTSPPVATPPRSVLTSRPRYRDVEPRFESDFDKAVYIVTNPGASKRHPEILAWVQSNAPDGFDVAGAGSVVRAKLKSLYRPGQPLEVRGQTVGKTLDDAAAPTIQGRPFTKPLGGPTDVPRQQQPPNLLPGTRDPLAPTGPAPVSAGPVPQQGRFTPPVAPVSQAVPSAGPVPTQPPLSPPPAPPKPPTGPVGGPPTPPPPPAFLPGMQRPSIAGNIIGLRDIDTGLTRTEELENVLLGAGRKAKAPFHLNNKYGTAAIREKQRVATAIDSQAIQRSHREATAIRDAFKGDLEEDLFVPSLAGKVTRVKGAPSIQDVSDFYPQYEPFLTPAQKAAIKPIADTHDQYTDLLNKVGVGFPSRASTQIGGGRYIARVAKGLASKVDEPRGVPVRGLFAKAQKGFEQEIQFETAAEGRAAGIKYAGIEDTLRFHYQQAGQRATEAHIANYLTAAVDDTNWPISLPRKGEMGRKAVDLAVLADYSFPEAIADSINKVLVSQGTTVGAGRHAFEAVRILNRGYRGLKATLDNSVMGIQILLPAYSHPFASAQAAKVNFQAWYDPKVLARYWDSFDAKAPSTGRLKVGEWAAEGNLHLGATTGEFDVRGLEKIPGFKRAGRAFGYTGDAERAQIADVLLEQEMHGFRLFGVGPELVGKGRTLAEIRASGDLAKIGEIANNMTGVARSRFGGDVGEILLFAPRFLQSRLETVAKGLAGMRPGAGLEQKIARRSLLKMIAIGTTLTVAINELNGQETDFRPIVRGRKNPNFMRIRALGRDWSLFGTWDSLLGLLITAGHGNVTGAVRSTASGVVTTAWDLLSGSDFIGRSTRSVENRAYYVGRMLLPFSGEQTVEGTEMALSGKPKDIATSAVVVASTLAGAKSSPISFTDHANEIAQAKYGTTWDRLKAERDAAREAAVAKGKTTSAEYSRLDKRMDVIADAVDKQYPKEAIPRRLSVSAKREEMAQRLYGKNYGDLYPNQQASINKKIAKGKSTGPSASDWLPRR